MLFVLSPPNRWRLGFISLTVVLSLCACEAIALPATYKPTNVAAQATAPGDVEVTWTSNNPNQEGYTVVLERNTIDHPNLWNRAAEVAAGATSATDHNAINPQNLTWRVCVYAVLDLSPACSVEVVLSPPAPPLPPPAAPILESVTPIAGLPAVEVVWQNVPGLRYELRALHTFAPAVATTSNEPRVAFHFGYYTPGTYPETGRSIGISLCAVSAQGVRTCEYREFERSTVRPTAAPSVGQLASTASDTVTLVWTQASNDVTQFAVWARMGDTWANYAWKLLGTPTARSFTHVGLAPGSQQTYRVCAVNPGGSTCSNLTVQVPQQRPPLPVNLRAVAVPNTIDRAEISWQLFAAMEPPVTMLQVLRHAEVGADETLSGPYNYTGYVDTHLVPGRLYRYYVRAANTAGWGPYGSVAVRLAIPLPLAPTALTATAEDARNIRLEWMPPAAFPPVTQLRVDRISNGRFVRVSIEEAGATGYGDTTPAAQTRYYYRVCAVNSFGETCSNTKGATTLAVEPGAPVFRKAGSSSDSRSITLGWATTSAGQNGFRLQLNQAGEWSDATEILPSTSRDGMVTGLQPSTVYKMRVCALYPSAPTGCSVATTYKTSP